MTVRIATILLVAAGLGSPALANETNNQLSSDQVREVQQALQSKGNAQELQADGMWGPKTEQALMNFQKSKNIKANGEIDAKTVAALGLNSSDFPSNESGQMRSSGGSSSSTSPSSSKSNQSTAPTTSSTAPSSTTPSSNSKP